MIALRKPLFLLVSGVVLFALGWWVQLPVFTDPDTDRASEILTQGIQKKHGAVKAEMALLKARFRTDGVTQTMVNHSDEYAAMFDNKGLFLAAFENNKLVFYSDNRVVFEYLFGPGIPDEQYLRLENGWYGLIKQIEENREYYALFLIRTAYPYQNTHLQNHFQRDFDLGPHYDLSVAPLENSSAVEIGEDTVFHVFKTEEPTPYSLWINLILLVSGFVLFLTSAARLATINLSFWWATLALPFLIVVLRLFSLSFSNPLAPIKLFDPTLYAASFLFPTLGDLLVNSLLMVWIAFYLFRRINIRKPRSFNWLVGVVLLVAVFSFGLYASPVITGLIENSKINFNLNDVFNLDIFTLLGLIIIGSVLYTFYLLSLTLLRILDWRSASPKKIWLALLVALVFYVVTAHLRGIVDFKIIMWPVAALLLISFKNYAVHAETRMRYGALLLFFFAVLTSLALLKYNAVKERNERLVYAEKLASDEDPVTELLFNSVANSMQQDEALHNMLVQPNRYANRSVADKISALFIDRYWNKYDLNIQVYHPNGNYWGILPEYRPPNLTDFDQIIAEQGFTTSTNPYLYHLYNYPENLSYLAKVPLMVQDTIQLAWAIIGLESTLFPDEIGFPRLLIENPPDNIRTLEAYSFARYIDDKLVGASGNYNYRLNTRLYEDNNNEFEFEDYKDYNHLIHRVDDRTLVVVSKRNLSFFDQVTVFSYLIALYGILILLLLVLQSSVALHPGFFNHLNVKIQLLSTGIILVALLSFGVATRFYTANQFEEKNQSILSEKIQSILIELDAPLKNEDHMTEPVIDQLKVLLTRLSYVFFTDINLYDPDGLLVATSQPKIFETGLVAPRMNAEAFVKITINKKSDFIHQETIGTLNYLSAYVPFRNYNNDIVAYVNLPYFARQDALEEEVTRLLVTLVNIFVLLLALSIFAAVFITDWITRPLQRLQQSLSRIELGRRNEQIEYQGSDVIANLVNVYNRKVAELEINAEQLARSERESAWREMAKQVAHEIKNPLTPMKLNIQLLQRAAAEGAEDLEERFERTAESLIEQIDTLSQIANAFSNFAKMPRAELAEVNLNKLITSAVELYKELPGATVRFVPCHPIDPIVHADYNQLLRAIQNLIKNGLQACEDEENPLIEISIRATESAYEITVSDNGAGIPDEMRDRIFQPNFTTKSTGMGLGLAMVMSIVQNINGKIWFETEKGVGTTFFIEIPSGS